MAKIQVNITTEGNINKYEAYKALCEEVGLKMLINGTANNYIVEDNILYELVNKSYHGSPKEEKKIYSKDFKTVILFENLLNVKCFLYEDANGNN